MEPIHGRLKSAPEEDVINAMPDNVVTNILDRLPLQDAVRTDVLSKTWRFKWNMLTQLVFDDDFFEYLRKTNDENYQVRVIISRLLLLLLRGPVTKFVLTVDHNVDIEDGDIRHWILFLSRKGIKDLAIVYWNNKPLKFTSHLFSCLALKHLKLTNCCLNPPPTFYGFPNLLSLYIHSQFEETSVFWEFITRCPLLDILKLDYEISLHKIKVAEIAKLENLKILSLYLCHIHTMNNLHSFSSAFELLASLPKLQELELNFIGWKVTEEGGATDRLSTAFPSLKALKLSLICFDDGMKLSCAFELIRSCPNLQTLEITTHYWHAGQAPQVDYNTTGQLQLRSVMFEYLNGSESELCLLKYLLACSPFLKKIVIHPYRFITSDEKLKFAMKLLRLHRASPDVDVDLN